MLSFLTMKLEASGRGTCLSFWAFYFLFFSFVLHFSWSRSCIKCALNFSMMQCLSCLWVWFSSVGNLFVTTRFLLLCKCFLVISYTLSLNDICSFYIRKWAELLHPYSYLTWKLLENSYFTCFDHFCSNVNLFKEFQDVWTQPISLQNMKYSRN